MINILSNIVDKIFSKYITDLYKEKKDKEEADNHGTEIEIFKYMLPYMNEVLYEIKSVTKEYVHIKRLCAKDAKGNNKYFEFEISLMPGESYFIKESVYGLKLVSIVYTLKDNRFERIEDKFVSIPSSVTKFDNMTRIYIDDKIGIYYDKVQRLSYLNELKGV